MCRGALCSAWRLATGDSLSPKPGHGLFQLHLPSPNWGSTPARGLLLLALLLN
ncbi:uncharacterized protein BP01DRAFT_358732 [Aspergillus saccharolyticus JOP 1030-1]|uniref:Uncharacterized protein n=1 Tax=Aspergillus saccharolyticus JOP 1030-1 TaxID=1450539 RepID=A0A318ZHP8_9EURO|nr:hypothetical protein BP01DRAFT_358732 [Aspergillus saccharolyticus JOP 1030-1]PYH43220.1 hypothetical protein BP01DRAFT_358732 [Aspergillus saccharolyticus JOP 1030-1]